MRHSASIGINRARRDRKSIKSRALKTESRHTVGLDPNLAKEVEIYAENTHASMSKAIAALVRLGLESQQTRKREFFKKLRSNLANDDPAQEDRLVEEFRNLILGG